MFKIVALTKSIIKVLYNFFEEICFLPTSYLVILLQISRYCIILKTKPNTTSKTEGKKTTTILFILSCRT